MTLFKGLLAALIVLFTGLNSLPINIQSHIVKMRDPSHPVQRIIQRLQSPQRCPPHVRSQLSIQEQQQQVHSIISQLGDSASDGWFIENTSENNFVESAGQSYDDGNDDDDLSEEHHPEHEPQQTGDDATVETKVNVSLNEHVDRSKEREGALRANQQQLWMDEMDNTSQDE